jgi:hypothetical protein
MQFLNLSEKEKIELLADGVRDPFLRRFALDTGASSVPNFIAHIRKITEDSVLVRRQTSDLNVRTNVKQVAQEMLCSHCKKKGHLVKDCRVANGTCFGCGQKGHLLSACPKRKGESGSTLNHLVQESSEPTLEETEALTAAEAGLAADSVCLIQNVTPYISVSSLENRNRIFCALVDTGSPVNLIRKSIYNKYFISNKLLQVEKNFTLKGINNSAITVYGKIHEQICLEKIKNQWFDAIFFVVDDNTIAFDMLLGREFFTNSKLKLTFQNGRFEFECSPEKQMIADILSINAINEKTNCDLILENLDEDLDFRAKNSLIDIFQEVENLNIDTIEDNYRIRVHLKDSSLFRYAPRRMSFAEKKDLFEITEICLNVV